MPGPPPFPEVLASWEFAPVPAAGLGVAALAYHRATARVAALGRRWAPARSGAFALGLVAVAAATQSFLGRWDTERFSLHAVQHLLLAMVAPVLLALGAPMTLALQGSRRETRTRLLRLLHSGPIRLLTHPLAAWAVFGATPFALYFTPLFGLTVRHEWLHQVVHVHFVASGCLFFWPLVGLDPLPRRLPNAARVALVFLAVPFHAILGVALLGTGHVLGGGAWSLADQQAGAGILWASGDLLALVVTGVVVVRWMAAEERAGARADRRIAEGSAT